MKMKGIVVLACCWSVAALSASTLAHAASVVGSHTFSQRWLEMPVAPRSPAISCRAQPVTIVAMATLRHERILNRIAPS